MQVKIKTAPAAYPVTTAEAKAHMRIEALNTDHDAYIDLLIAEAVEEAETITKRRFITQTWYGYLDEWPAGDRIALPFGQLQSVTAITYRDTDEDESTFSSDDYIATITADPGYIVLGDGKSWPTDSLSPSLPICIEFVCGYGDAGSAVPDGIKHAIKMRIADRFEHRENYVVGGGITVTTDLKIFERTLWAYTVAG